VTTSAQLSLRERVERQRWYHTIELPEGNVTAGWFDTRATVGKVPLPASLEGKRCLDVGTWDGFWAFEMERRGAESVLAIDLQDQDQWDWPPETRLRGVIDAKRAKVEDFKDEHAGFELAKEALGSNVEHRKLSIYDLDPATVGTFDFVFLGSLLLHLRDPVRALDALRSVVGDEAVIADTVDAIPSFLQRRTPTARLEGVNRPWWWQPNREGLLQMMRSAGFEVVEATRVYLLPLGAGHPRSPLRKLWRSARTARGRQEIIIRLGGIPHVAARVRPLR
jgi:tRNA (mo5U34)-methyltransferase